MTDNQNNLEAQLSPRPSTRRTASTSAPSTTAESLTVVETDPSIYNEGNRRKSLDTEAAKPESAPPFRASTTLKLAVASLCCVSLAAALDATSLSIALPVITDKLGGNALLSFWAGTSFLLTCAVFQPVVGGLSHIFGRKEVRINLAYGR